jgi:polyhydroxybutyrate depolymerase
MIRPSVLLRPLRSMAAALLAATFALPAAAADLPGQVRVAGTLRTYTLHVPDAAAPRRGFPLVFAFHGGGMQGEGMRRMTGLDAVADARGFMVVYPDGADGHWNDGRATIRHPQDDVAFVSAMIDQLGRGRRVDRKRIYATGISNGALFAQRVGCALSRRVAAIAPVAGTLAADLAPACKPARPVAVLQIGGTADPVMPFKGGAVADLGGRGEGGSVLSVIDTISFWTRANGCGVPDVPQVLPPVAAHDPTRISRTRYSDCARGGAVTLLTVVGGGHTWLGSHAPEQPAITGPLSRQLDASTAIADFFLAQPPR